MKTTVSEISGNVLEITNKTKKTIGKTLIILNSLRHACTTMEQKCLENLLAHISIVKKKRLS